MLSKLKQHKSEGFTISRARMREQGFTIIEVMIVLAIAGLIILIVLLAVPALQRNSRNTAIKNDASALAAGVQEYLSNNDGVAPKVATQSGSSVTFCDAATCGATISQAVAKVQGSTVVKYESATPATAANYAPGSVDIDFGYKCTGTGAAVSAQARATAVIYSVETAGAAQPKCVDA